MHHKKRTLRLFSLLLGSSLTLQSSLGQFSANFQTNIVSGVTNGSTGSDYIIGSSYSGNVLIVTNGGLLRDLSGVLGQLPSSSNNAAVVTGPTARWNNNSILAVGLSGFGNQLTISDGGQVMNNADGYIGRTSVASHNSVTVTGGVSSWSNRTDLYVGYDGFSNQLMVLNGGRVASSNAYIGGWSGSSFNQVLVSGSGSIWTNHSRLYLSYLGASGNSLVISNGGRVINSYGSIGGSSFGIGTSNLVVVTGQDSVWTNRNHLSIGNKGGYNSLVISNGGTVFNDSAFVGDFGSSNNTMLVTGSGSLWSHRDELEVGYLSGGNRLTIENGGRVFSSKGLVGLSDFPSNQTFVTGVGSVWSNSTELIVAYYGFSTSLVISNSGRVVTPRLIAAYNSLASNNVIQVPGGSLIVTNSPGEFILGYGGAAKLVLNGGTVLANKLFVTNGAKSAVEFTAGELHARDITVANATVFEVGDGANTAELYLSGGNHSFADGLRIRTNAVLHACGVVTGGLLMEGDLRVECGGGTSFHGAITNFGRIEVNSGDILAFYGPVVNYGQIIATNGAVRYHATFDNFGTLVGNIANGTNVWMNSAGGKWEASSNWSGGVPDNGFQCVIANPTSKTVVIDATTVAAQPDSLAILGLDLSAANNSINTLVLQNSGISNVMQIANNLSVGNGGSLIVSNGAIELGGSLTVDGAMALSSGAWIMTDGPALIGEHSSSAVMVSDSSVTTFGTILGQNTNASGKLTVTGSNSIWNASSDVYVGSEGRANNLVLSNGGSLFGDAGYIGGGLESSSNNVLIAGAGSAWKSSANLHLGHAGADNTLNVSNGGRVSDNSGVLGWDASSTNNRAIVTGAGSTWSNYVGMYVGWGGSGNSLVISNGGKMTAADFGLGYYSADSGNNTLRVTGTGSMISYTTVSDAIGYMTVGWIGSDNNLLIEDGGKVFSNYGYLGIEETSSNNLTVVSGTGSVWHNDQDLFIGGSGWGYGGGAANSLVISNGGQVISQSSHMGGAASSSNNLAYVGAGAIWSNEALCIGERGPNNTVTISAGSVLAADLVMGLTATSGCDNLLQLDSGNLVVTNATANAVLDVRRGKIILNAGLLRTDILILTNACSRFVRNGGTLMVGSLVLDPNLDADADGLPNYWEQNYNLDPLYPADGQSDSDNDGMTNWQEYLAGTNPTNSNSRLRITAQVLAGDDVRVSWPAVGGKSYVVQTSAILGAGFADLSPIITIPGIAETVTNYLDMGAATNWPGRFYRIRLGP